MVALTGGRPRLSPLVRRLAAEHSLSLAAITGTGSDGRIRKQDVRDAARAQRATEAAARAVPARAATAQAGRAERSLAALAWRYPAARESLQTSAQLTTVIDGDNVTYHDAEHLGIAVDTDRGLIVPVIHHAGDLNIGGLARATADLAARARSGHAGPDELSGATFTLTDTGSRGALFDTPIINQPRVAILGAGTVVRRPVVVEDPSLGEVIAVRSMLYLALTYDHRLIDGADAARYLTTVKARLEEGAFEPSLGL
ncbi:MAG TPA: 2-oxo acid dehydrogenase subunit E2 [Trebonia sp.]|nr:2-oxo acid dehydrogenase subunit E2 [Trebonia sp.]